MRNRRHFTRDAALMAALLISPVSWSKVSAEKRKLPRRPIPGGELSLPVIGLGNSNAFRQNDIPGSTALLKLLHEKGGAYVDCSGSSRYVVAKAASSLRIGPDLFLGNYFVGDDESAMREDITRLLRLTGKEKLDLAQSYTEYSEANWHMFKQWKEEGLTTHIGTARHNVKYYESMMKMMASGTLDFLQVNYSPLETAADQNVLPMALERGVAVTINRPFINGNYFSHVKGHKLPEWAKEFDCESWAQFSLKFILSHPAVTCVLTETANPKHALDNIGAGFGSLPNEKTRKRMVRHLLSL